MWELLGDGLTLRDALLELLQFGDNLIPPRNLCVKKQLQGGNGAKCFLWPKVNSAVSVGMCKLSPINFIALRGGGPAISSSSQWLRGRLWPPVQEGVDWNAFG